MAQTEEQDGEFRMDFVQQIASQQSVGNERPVTFIAQTPSTSSGAMAQPDPRLLQSPTEEHKTAEQKGALLRNIFPEAPFFKHCRSP